MAYAAPLARSLTALVAALLGDLVHAGLRDVGFLGYQTLFQRIRVS